MSRKEQAFYLLVFVIGLTLMGADRLLSRVKGGSSHA